MDQRRDDYDSAADAENVHCHTNDKADKTKMSPNGNVGNLCNTGRSAEFAPPAALAELPPTHIRPFSPFNFVRTILSLFFFEATMISYERNC